MGKGVDIMSTTMKGVFDEVGMTNEQFQIFLRTLKLLVGKAESLEEVKELIDEVSQVWIPEPKKED